MTIDGSILTGARGARHAVQAASGDDLPQPLKREIACGSVMVRVL